jgi:hypothetical protein
MKLPFAAAFFSFIIATISLAQDNNFDASPIQEQIAGFLKANRGDVAVPPEAEGSREEVEKLLATLDEKLEREAFLKLSLEYLHRFPAGESFPKLLWRAAVYAEWQERSAGPLWAKPILPLLLDSCDQLPADNPYRFEGIYLRASWLEKQGKPAESAKILTTTLATPDFPERFFIPFHTSLAKVSQAAGDLPAAIEAAGKLEGEIAKNAAALETWFRSCYLLLVLNRTDEAVARLKKLGDTPADTVANKPYGGLLLDMVNLAARDDTAWETYRKDTTAWTEKWAELRKDLGLTDSLPSPNLPSAMPDRLKQDGDNALRFGNTAAFWAILDQWMSLAQWQPLAALEAASYMTPPAFEAAPEKTDVLRELIVLLLTKAQPLDPLNERRREVLLAVHLIDLGRMDEAEKVVEAFGARNQANDPIGQTMIRLWGIIRQRKGGDLDDPIRALRDLLDSGDPVIDRSLMTSTLADLLHQSSRYEEEAELLQKELENPEIKNGPSFLSLSGRYSGLLEQIRTTREFQDALTHWIKQVDLGWLEKVEPKTIAGPLPTQLESLVTEPEAVYSEAESVKFRLLVALDSKQPLSLRAEAFGRALETLIRSTNSLARLTKLVDSVAGEERFPTGLRAMALWHGTITAMDHDLSEAADWANHPLVDSLPPAQLAVMANFRRLLSIEGRNPEALLALYKELAVGELDRGRSALIREIHSRLIALNAMEAAETIVADSAAFRFFAEPGATTKEEFQWSLDRMLRIGKAQGPAHMELRQRALTFLATLPPEDHLPGANTSQLSHGDAFNALMGDLISGRAGENVIGFWSDWLSTLNANNDQTDVVFEMLEAFLKKCTEDRMRSLMILASQEAVDIDDPDVIAKLKTITNPWRDPAAHPYSFAVLTCLDIHLAIRHGTDPTAVSRLSGIDHPALDRIKAHLTLAAARQNHSKTKDAILEALDTIPPDLLFSPGLIEDTYAALVSSTSADDPRRQIARQAALREWQKRVADAWMTGSSADALAAIRLSVLLGDDAPLDEKWFARCTAANQNERRAFLLDVTWYAAQKDSAKTIDVAKKAIETYPTYYSFYLLRGKALLQEDRKKEALADLEIYLRYCRDESEFPEALRLFKEAGGTEDPVPKTK